MAECFLTSTSTLSSPHKWIISTTSITDNVIQKFKLTLAASTDVCVAIAADSLCYPHCPIDSSANDSAVVILILVIRIIDVRDANLC